MKKLNITKKKFNESKYFQTKYGKLEYVSESGELYKTTKCKVLKFNEGVEQPQVAESPDDMEKEFTSHGISITRYDYESLPDPMAAYKLDDTTMQKIADEIYHELSKNWSEEEIDQYLGHPVDEKDVSYDMIQDDFLAEMESVAIYNGMKYYEDLGDDIDEMNESSDDIDNDPAYTCPYCGGHNCEFVDADDYPEEGYFDGSTLGATYNCQGCNKDYLVTFSLSVVDKHSAKVRPLNKN